MKTIANLADKSIQLFYVIIIVLIIIYLLGFYNHQEINKPRGFVKFVTFTAIFLIVILLFFMFSTSARLNKLFM
jgi:uncharacterized membrane protein